MNIRTFFQLLYSDHLNKFHPNKIIMNEYQTTLTIVLCVLISILFICPICLFITQNWSWSREDNNSSEPSRRFNSDSDSGSENPVWRDYDTDRNYVRFEDEPQIVD
jgi:hypothetical protein